MGAQWCEIDQRETFAIGRCDGHLATAAAPRWFRRLSDPVAGESDRSAKKLVYATDTSGDVGADAARFCGHADLLMHECYFRDSGKHWAEKTGHCWTSRLAEVIKASQPKKTLVTHVNPLESRDDPVEIAWIRDQTGGDVFLATDGAVIDF